MSDSDPLDLSAQDLMPNWVTNLEKSLPGESSKPDRQKQDREFRDDRGGRGGGGGRGKGRGGKRDRNWGDDRRSGGGGNRDRRGGVGPRGGKGGDRRGGGGRGGRDRFDDRRQRPQEEPLPEGITLSVEPDPHAAAALAKHIKSSGRTYALADLARMVLSARERYRIRFRTESKEKSPLYLCKDDKSVWLNRDEALSHVLRSSALKRFYEVEEVAVEPPKGNFSVVAVCGFTGQILGPPNHHEYQTNVARLHRERFANMSLDRYRSRIEMKRDEETIEKWKELVSTRRQYRVRPEPLTSDPDAKAPKPEEAPTPDPETAKESAPDETHAAATDAETPEGTPETPAEEPVAATESAAEETPASEGVAEETSAEEAGDGAAEPEGEEPSSAEEGAGDAEAAAAEEETPKAPEPEAEILPNAEALERHFRAHYADRAVKTVANAVVPGNIPGRSLSRPLLNLLKSEIDRSRKSFPLAMIQHLCREFEKAGLKFFKRGKKALHVSVARPRAITNEEDFSEKVREVVNFVREHPKARVVDLLDALVSDYQKPAKGESFEEHHLTDAERQVLANLRWLTMEGYVIEFPNSELVLGKQDPPAPAKKAAKTRKPKEEPQKRKEPKSEKPKVETDEKKSEASEPESKDTANEPAEAPAPSSETDAAPESAESAAATSAEETPEPETVGAVSDAKTETGAETVPESSSGEKAEAAATEAPHPSETESAPTAEGEVEAEPVSETPAEPQTEETPVESTETAEEPPEVQSSETPPEPEAPGDETKPPAAPESEAS